LLAGNLLKTLWANLSKQHLKSSVRKWKIKLRLDISHVSLCWVFTANKHILLPLSSFNKLQVLEIESLGTCSLALMLNAEWKKTFEEFLKLQKLMHYHIYSQIKNVIHVKEYKKIQEKNK